MRTLGSIATISRGPAAYDASDEAGFTLVEVLVACVMSIALIGAVLSLLESSQRVQARDTEFGLVLQEGRTGLSRMAREIRQAYSVKSASPNSIDFLIDLGGKNYEVLYECSVTQPGTSLHECVRLAAGEGKSLPPLSAGAPVVQRIGNETSIDTHGSPDPVFTYSPDAISPNVVTLKLVLPASGSLSKELGLGLKHNIVLTTAAYIRAMNLGA